MVLYLLENTEAKEYVNYLDLDGNTPLHYAWTIREKSVREMAVNCLLSNGANENIRNGEGFRAADKWHIILLSDAYQGQTTFFMQATGYCIAGRLKSKFESIRILPQMLGVVNTTLERMQRHTNLSLNGKGFNEALETLERVKREYPSLEELKWDSEMGLKDALREIWENDGFQNALEKKYSAMHHQFFGRIDELSKPGYVASDRDLVHLHLKPMG